MNIIFLITATHVGGAERFLYNTCLHWKKIYPLQECMQRAKQQYHFCKKANSMDAMMKAYRNIYIGEYDKR